MRIERTADARANFYPAMPDVEVVTTDGEALADRWRILGYWARPLRVDGYLLICVRCAGGGYRYPERVRLGVSVVRETFGRQLDSVLTLLAYAGAHTATIAEVRGVFRAQKRVGRAALDVIAAWERPTEDFSPAEMDAAIGRLRAAVHATADREGARV